MAKYWAKQIFVHGSFPEVGEKQKTEREKKKEKRGENERWTRVGSGGRDQTLAVKSRKNNRKLDIFLVHIPSSWVKI